MGARNVRWRLSDAVPVAAMSRQWHDTARKDKGCVQSKRKTVGRQSRYISGLDGGGQSINTIVLHGSSKLEVRAVSGLRSEFRANAGQSLFPRASLQLQFTRPPTAGEVSRHRSRWDRLVRSISLPQSYTSPCLCKSHPRRRAYLHPHTDKPSVISLAKR